MNEKTFAVAMTATKYINNETSSMSILMEVIKAQNKEEALGKFITQIHDPNYYLGAYRVMEVGGE